MQNKSGILFRLKKVVSMNGLHDQLQLDGERTYSIGSNYRQEGDLLELKQRMDLMLDTSSSDLDANL